MVKPCARQERIKEHGGESMCKKRAVIKRTVVNPCARREKLKIERWQVHVQEKRREKW
jgi:hypothetical protein